MQKQTNIFSIFLAFVKIGFILLGGGYVIVPIVKQELVEKRNWIDENELFDFYCVAQCLPGIIAINTSILVAYKIRKIKGVLAAILGICLSPIISILIVANLINQISSLDIMNSIFWGVNISVIILIYLTLKEMWNKSIVNFFTFFWFLLITALSIFKVSPALLIIISIVFGILLEIKKGGFRKNG